ncbi:hypothetical protein U9M48_001893 [Paspalum notatum var. saurae]|uniref:Terpene synthase n=1 Tax=Paspalum notatum var. saurae TaxID=547442 RepID=A0AAQ3PPD0_PASNO
MTERVNQLKVEVSGLFGACKSTVEKMNLVDALQHLGIDHHFEEPIASTMSSIHNAEFVSSSLHEAALRFRLLRQHGFWVSADEFSKFKDEGGHFVNDITNDPKTLLSLYNAANLLTHNERQLEEALLFSRHHLEVMQCNLESPLAEQVERALKIPLQRNLKREEAIYYIPEYNVQDDMYNSAILELAKLDFNRLQRIHQKELKAVSMWDETDVSLLPEYLQKFFLQIMSNFKEFDKLLEPHEKYRSAYIRKVFQNMSKCYLQEAEWSHHDYTPSFDEQVNISVKSAGGELVAVGALFGLGDIATKEIFEWAINNSDTVRACGEVSRFMDDMADFKDSSDWIIGVTPSELFHAFLFGADIFYDLAEN